MRCKLGTLAEKMRQLTTQQKSLFLPRQKKGQKKEREQIQTFPLNAKVQDLSSHLS